MHCLVEVHTLEEVQRAISVGARIIGINSRDLKTFQIHPDLIRELRPLNPKDTVVVAESGIHTSADARRLARYDVDAMLVGESLVTSQDIPAQIRTLLKGANENVQVKITSIDLARRRLGLSIRQALDDMMSGQMEPEKGEASAILDQEAQPPPPPNEELQKLAALQFEDETVGL